MSKPKKTRIPKIPMRSGEAQAALARRAPTMDHRLEPKGGAGMAADLLDDQMLTEYEHQTFTRRRKVTVSVCLPCTVTCYVEANTIDGEEPDEHSDWTIVSIRDVHAETTPRAMGEHMIEDDCVDMCKSAARAENES